MALYGQTPAVLFEITQSAHGSSVMKHFDKKQID